MRRPSPLPTEPSVEGDAQGTQPPQSISTRPLHAPAAGSSANLTGARLGPYELLEEIGRGGMGAVYKARHARLGKIVAIKVLPHNLTEDRDALARFDREMRAVGALDHPNIVRAFDAGDENGIHYLSLEFVDGLDLQKWVAKNGPLSIANACKIIRQAATGLAHAHERGLVHRDIKPSNLLITKQGKLKVLDLGLARLTDGQVGNSLTSQGMWMGTPDYMAPEQWADTHGVDARADLYALGCTLYFLLNGRAPFGDEKHSTFANKMTAHIHEPPPELSSQRGEAPKPLRSIYAKLLAKNPAERFATARQLVEALQPLCTSSTAIDAEVIEPPPIIDSVPPSTPAPKRTGAPQVATPRPTPKPVPPAQHILTHASPQRFWQGHPVWVWIVGISVVVLLSPLFVVLVIFACAFVYGVLQGLAEIEAPAKSSSYPKVSYSAPYSSYETKADPSPPTYRPDSTYAPASTDGIESTGTTNFYGGSTSAP